MAGKLTCEICGGALMAQPGGVFECEFCGTKYSKAWMQEKIQEIKGTVKVEGTVQVEGTVKLDGPVEVKNAGPNLNSLLKRAWEQLKEPYKYEGYKRVSDEFDATINKLKDMDVSCAEIYVLETLRAIQFTDMEALKTTALEFTKLPSWKKAMECAEGAYKEQLQNIVLAQKQHVDKWTAMFHERWKKVGPVQNLVRNTSAYAAALKADGELLLTYDEEKAPWLAPARSWFGITAICGDSNFLAGVCVDGTIKLVHTQRWEYQNTDAFAKVTGWKRVYKVTAHEVADRELDSWEANRKQQRDLVLVGLQNDGTLLCTEPQLLSKTCIKDVEDYTFCLNLYRNRSYYDPSAHLLLRNGQMYTLDGIVKYEKTYTFSNGILQGGIYETDSHRRKTRTCGVIDSTYDHLLMADGTFKRKNGQSVEKDVAAVWSYGGNIFIILKDDGCVEILNDSEDPIEKAPLLMNIYKGNWRLFNSLETLPQERMEAERTFQQKQQVMLEAARRERLRAEMEARKARLLEIKAEAQALQAELANLKGMFTGKRRKEIEERLAILREDFRKTKEAYTELEERK